METIAYLPDRVFTGTDWMHRLAVVVSGGRVQSLTEPSSLPEGIPVRELPNSFLAPAYIDLQIYGAYSQLFAVYPTVEALKALTDYCRKGGAFLCQPTVATNAPEVFHRCIDAVRAYWEGGGNGVHGLHLEGPWINAAKKGAHIEKEIHAPSVAEVEAMLEYGKGVITMITVAPEVCSDEVLDLLLRSGIVVSAGHSNATFAQATAAFDRGIPAVTHLYNAMSPLQHRGPGLVGASFLHPKVRASIIPDGHHVDFEAVKVAKQMMGDRLFVITDAVTETSEGPYPHQKEGDKYVSNGTLSGSALTMHGSVKNLVNRAGVPLEEALRMCSTYPARVIGREREYGMIAPGYAAQFVQLDEALNLISVPDGSRG